MCFWGGGARMAFINNIYNETITFNHLGPGTFRFNPHVDTLQSQDPIPFKGDFVSYGLLTLPIPAFPPYAVRTPHIHGTPPTVDTTREPISRAERWEKNSGLLVCLVFMSVLYLMSVL